MSSPQSAILPTAASSAADQQPDPHSANIEPGEIREDEQVPEAPASANVGAIADPGLTPAGGASGAAGTSGGHHDRDPDSELSEPDLEPDSEVRRPATLKDLGSYM